MEKIKIKDKDLIEIVESSVKSKNAIHAEIITLSYTISENQTRMFRAIENEYPELKTKEYSVDHKNNTVVVHRDKPE